jgi:hypothetical protein
MKTTTYIKHLIVLCLFSLLPLNASAKEITIYDQPLSIAKPVGKVDLSAGVIPIFSHKPGDWVKVGDPRNGNVGWARSSELGNANISFSIIQSTDSKNKSSSTYRVIEFGTPSKSDANEKMMQIMQQQENAQKAMYKAIQDMMNNMNR